MCDWWKSWETLLNQLCAMTFLSPNNTLSIHHPVLLWVKSFTFVLQMKNIRKICHTHPKSKEPKVSVLRTHLYPSRCENPSRTLNESSAAAPQKCSFEANHYWNNPKCANPGSVMLSTEMCERFWKGKSQRKRAWSGSVMCDRVRDGSVSSGVRAQDQ